MLPRWFPRTQTSSPTYHGLNQKTESETSDEEASVQLVHRSSSPRTLAATFILSLSSLIILLYQTFNPLARQASSPSLLPLQNGSLQPQELGNCGLTSDEARARGCRFDPMTWVWQRPECYREELIEDFLGRTEWRMFTNYTLLPEEEIPREEWLRGDHDVVYSHYKYHLLHCTYMWRKLHTAYLHHLPTDTASIEEQHTLHCELQIINNITHETQFECPDGLPFACPSILRSGTTACRYY